MAPCYVVFEGKKPGIYMSWHECSLHVLGYKNARYKKYGNYDQVVHDYNTSKALAFVSQEPEHVHISALPIGSPGSPMVSKVVGKMWLF